jgi:hypothetical protein
MVMVPVCIVFKVARFFAWSIDIATKGIGPCLGFANEEFPRSSIRYGLRGQVLAGGWTACYVGMKHDAKAKREVHKHTQNYMATYCCCDCFAVKGTKHAPPHLFFSDFGPDAMWRATMICHESYVLTEPDPTPWLQVTGHRKDPSPEHDSYVLAS